MQISSAGYELESDEMSNEKRLFKLGRPDEESPGEEVCHSSVHVRARPRGTSNADQFMTGDVRSSVINESRFYLNAI